MTDEKLREIDETLRTVAPVVIPRDILEIAAEERLIKLALELVRDNQRQAAIEALDYAVGLSNISALKKALWRCVSVMEMSRDEERLELYSSAFEAARRIEALLSVSEVAQ